MTSEETIRNQAKEIATLKADIALLKETLTHGLACMKTAREVHKADVAVIREGHRAEVEKLKGVITVQAEHMERERKAKGPRVETFSAGGGPLVFTL